MKQSMLALVAVAAAAADFGIVEASGTLGRQHQESAPPRPSNGNTLVFADFERMENNRPVSTRGGLIQLYGYGESRTHKSTFKGLDRADPPAPELVHIKKGDPNRVMKFDYSLLAPNQWAGVTVEIPGLPDAGGAAVPEDVSGFCDQCELNRQAMVIVDNVVFEK